MTDDCSYSNDKNEQETVTYRESCPCAPASSMRFLSSETKWIKDCPNTLKTEE